MSRFSSAKKTGKYLMVRQQMSNPFKGDILKVIKKKTNRRKEVSYFVRYVDEGIEGEWIEEDKMRSQWEKVEEFEKELLRQKTERVRKQAEEKQKLKQQSKDPVVIVLSSDSEEPVQMTKKMTLQDEEPQNKNPNMSKSRPVKPHSGNAKGRSKKRKNEQTQMKEEEEPQDLCEPQQGKARNEMINEETQDDSNLVVLRLNPFTGETNSHHESEEYQAQRTALMEVMVMQKNALPPVKVLKAVKVSEVVMIVVEMEGKKMQIAEEQFRKYWHQELINFYREKFDLVTMAERVPDIE